MENGTALRPVFLGLLYGLGLHAKNGFRFLESGGRCQYKQGLMLQYSVFQRLGSFEPVFCSLSAVHGERQPMARSHSYGHGARDSCGLPLSRRVTSDAVSRGCPTRQRLENLDRFEKVLFLVEHGHLMWS